MQPVILSNNSSDETRETESFAELVAGHQARLHGYIRSLIPDPQFTRDILQETNMVLLRKEKNYERGTNFSAWALRVAYFEVLTWRRNKGRDRLVFDDETLEKIATQAEEMSLEEEQRRTALRDCLKKLPERQHSVVKQHFFDSGSVREIADSEGLKSNAISQLLFRAKRNLARCVSERLSRLAAQ